MNTPKRATNGARAKDNDFRWWCYLQERDGRLCRFCEYLRKPEGKRRAVCTFLGGTIPREQLQRV